jgi:hypothetical protein
MPAALYPQGHSAAGIIRSTEKSNDVGNQTDDLALNIPFKFVICRSLKAQCTTDKNGKSKLLKIMAV